MITLFDRVDGAAPSHWWEQYLPDIADALATLSGAGNLYPAVLVTPHGLRYYTDVEYRELCDRYFATGQGKALIAQAQDMLTQKEADKVARLRQPVDN